MTATLETPVLIVGGGPVGLSLALDLDFMGVPCTVVERDEGTATVLLAKAGTLNERTMEFVRRWGLVDEVARCFPDDHSRDTVYCTSLSGAFIGRSRVPSTNERGVPDGGPEMLRKCAQFLFDPILARAVQRSRHAKLLYGREFEGVQQDADGVTCTVRDLKSNTVETIRAQYVVGCDGTGSQVRQAVGISFGGEHLDYSLSAMVRIEHLERYHDYGTLERFMFIGANGTWANMTAVDGDKLWRFSVVGSEARLAADGFDIHASLRRAFGTLDIPYQVVRMVPWKRAQYLVDDYHRGRVVLAGDSAHSTSPTGGHGLNTGIGDIAGLSWMLKALVEGWGGDKLLDAYTIERRAVAVRNFSSSTSNYKAWVGKGMANVEQPGPVGEAARRNIGNWLRSALHQEWFSQGIAYGYSYDTSPIVANDGTPRPYDDPTRYIQTARAGHRAPHAWLTDGRSTIDLFGRGFVLLRFDDPSAGDSPLAAEAAKAGVPFATVHIDQPEIAALYERKYVLVRPDGMVAWRDDVWPASPSTLIDRIRGA